MTMKDILSPKYNDAVNKIKTAIMQSQSKALASVNQEQPALYYGIGRYICLDTNSPVATGELNSNSVKKFAKFANLSFFVLPLKKR